MHRFLFLHLHPIFLTAYLTTPVLVFVCAAPRLSFSLYFIVHLFAFTSSASPLLLLTAKANRSTAPLLSPPPLPSL
jgi:hypothetical protein